jgi:UDP-N-acetylmuramoyl-tripeptide--D-alanyl-D-alanine ligase
VPSNNRSQVIQKGSNTILMDAYNANPSSMTLALESFAKIKAQQKVVILGDMFELGEMSDSEHQKIGELLAELAFDIVVLFGSAMQNAILANSKAFYFTDKFSLHNWLQDKKIENTHILIKGSRGVALETVLQFI